MELKEFSVVFVADRSSLSSRIIEFYQRVKNFKFDEPVPTHTEFYLFDGITITADAIGVRYSKIKRHLKGKKKVWIVELDLDDIQKAIILKFLQSQIGRPYDYKAIIWFATKFPILGNLIAKLIRLILKHNIKPDQYAYFCSELVCTALKYSLTSFQTIPAEITPFELLFYLKFYPIPEVRDIKVIYNQL